MLLTPRIIRTHEYTARDLSPIYVGTNQNFGLTGPPPLIAAPPVEPDTTPAPGAAMPAPDVPPQGLPVPTAPQGGTPGLPVTPAARAGCTARRSAGATRPDGADDDHSRADRADFCNRAGRRSACRRRPVHGADLRQRRVARVNGDADSDIQPGRSSDEDRSGGQLPATGRRERRLYAEYRRRNRPRRPGVRAHRRQPWAHPGRACWRRFNSMPLAPGTSQLAVSGVLANPTGGTIPVQFVPASVVVR